MKTVVGLYSTVAEANKVKSTLQTEGYETSHITVIDQTGEGYAGKSTSGTGVGDKIKDFFTGFSDHTDEHAQYAQRVGNGGALLAVTVPDEEADETADMLYEHGATGIQDDYQGGNTGSAKDVAVLEGSRDRVGSTTGEQVIPVVAEELVVGKREVERGGVRIFSHVVEKPVSENVTLHDERVVVDRRPVDRAATAADFETGSGAIEVTATGEEAVVGKTSRVVEEVRVGKQGTDRTEQISDTVRHTEVDVEQTPAKTTTKDRY